MIRFLQEAPEKVLKYKTFVVGGPRDYFKEVVRSETNLKKWQRIYEQGGLISEAIDCYPLFTLSKGYQFVGEDEALRKQVQDWAEGFDFSGEIWQLMVEALVK